MGWTIHDGRGGGIAPSCTAVDQVGAACAHVLPARHYRAVRGLFNRPGDPFVVKPKDARRIADALTAAAGDRNMPTPQAVLAAKIAKSARAAADASRDWKWS